jgi:hypothetical protein
VLISACSTRGPRPETSATQAPADPTAVANGLEDVSTWPPQELDPNDYSGGEERHRILHERFTQASQAPLGVPGDAAAIKKAIYARRAVVTEVRWLSPTLVVARAGGGMPGGHISYYFVVRKKPGTWEVLTYYVTGVE